MSTILLTEQGTPPTPPAGKVRLFFNTSGNLCSIDDTGTVSIFAAGLTAEQVQDIIGGILADTPSVDFIYDDALDQITATVLPAGVDHDALQNFVANEHVDHSAVSINAGTGLTGGGDITTSRTLNLADTAVTPGTYGSASVYPVITVDAQGRITSASTQATPGGVLMAKTSSPVTNSSNVTLTSLTALSLTLAASTVYRIQGTLIIRSALNTTGITVSFDGGTVVASSITGYIETANTAAAIQRRNFQSLSATAGIIGLAAGNTDQLLDMVLIVAVDSTGGTFIPQFRSDINGSDVTVQSNSFITAEVI